MSDFPVSDADDIELRKRARRRLVGAAALALLAAILLPLAMDDKAPPAMPDVRVSVPTRDDAPLAATGPESGRVDLEPDAAPAPGPSSPEPLPLSLPPFVAPEPPIVPEPRIAPPIAPEPPADPAPPLVAPEPRQPATPPRARPTPRAGGRDAEAERALALLNGTPAPAPAAPAPASATTNKGKVYVQAASFSDARRAAALAASLKKQGFAAYAEKAGKVHRVRIGPLPRREGERVAARLKAKGHAALLVSR